MSWKRKLAFWKRDSVTQHRCTERTADQCYQNRLTLQKPGDEQSDWENAEKIVQNPVRGLLFRFHCLWIKSRPRITSSLIFSAVAVCFTWWLDHQAEVRQRTTSQNLHHQRVLESYIGNIKEISLSKDYSDSSESIQERTFIMGMTLPVLRELTHDEARKAQLVLFLYQMQMCGITADQTCQKSATPAAPAEQPDPSEQTILALPDFLQTADLKFANFRGYKLPNISFRGADLRGANLASADLGEAALVSANLSCHQRDTETWWSWVPFLPQATKQVCTTLQGTNLQEADLSGTVLSGAILLGTDLHNAQGLTQAQLTGEQPPWLCNVRLPAELNRESLRNRDCGTIANTLHQQHRSKFPTLKKAQNFVKEQQDKDWK